MKKHKVIRILVPRYSELSVDEIWSMIKEINDIMEYFKDYTKKQIPESKYLFSELTTTRYKQLESKVKNSRKQRAKENDLSEDEFIYVDKNILSEIEEVMAQKSKYLSFNFNLATKAAPTIYWENVLNSREIASIQRNTLFRFQILWEIVIVKKRKKRTTWNK